MKVIRNIILFFKHRLLKKETVKALEAPKEEKEQRKKEDFMKSLKIMQIEEKNKKEVETLICTGDGLGIQKRLTY